MARRLIERGVRFVQVYSDGEWEPVALKPRWIGSCRFRTVRHLLSRHSGFPRGDWRMVIGSEWKSADPHDDRPK